jgi:transposase
MYSNPEGAMPTHPRYFAGLDWASEKHDLCILDAHGQIVHRDVIPHSADGLAHLVRQLKKYPHLQIALERPSGLLVDTLLEAGLAVVPIHPNKLSATRSRYSANLAISDPSDAYILGDLLRTDGHRFAPLQAPSDRTKALRAATRTRDDLVETRTQLSNQLRDLLISFWPGTVGLFHELHGRISLAFLERYPTPESTARLGEKRLAAFLKKNSYPGRQSPAALLAKLRVAPAGKAAAQESRLKGELVQSLVAVLRTLQTQIKSLEKKIAAALAEHPDQEWIRSFPCLGTTTAAQILAEIGEDRRRFEDDEHLGAEGGVRPVTRGSGKKKTVSFRYACNKRLRKALTCWADNSRKKSPWAEEIYRKAIQRGCSHPHAVRILACAWLRIFYVCWKNQAAYDPAKHAGARRFTARKRAA